VARHDRDAASGNSTDAVAAYTDRDSHAHDGGGATECDCTITDCGGAAEVTLCIGGRAHGGAGGGKCGRSVFGHRGDGADVRVYTNCPSYYQGAVPEEVALTKGLLVFLNTYRNNP
jgi:hypothetical protein